MQLKERLQDYTKDEFYQFVQSIWAVDTPGDVHDRMIAHFDKIAGEPRGADLLFYPTVDDLAGGEESEVAFIAVLGWHLSNKQPLFKGYTAPQPPPAMDARARSTKKLEDARNLIAELQRRAQVTQSALDNHAQKLDIAQKQILPATNQALNKNVFVQAEHELNALDDTRSEIITALNRYTFQGSTLETSLRFTKGWPASPFEDAGIQQQTLQALTNAQEQYQSQRASFGQRHETLHRQAQVMFKKAQEHLVRIAVAAKTGPLQEPLTLYSRLSGIDSYPRLITAHPARFEAFIYQLPEVRHAIRSAVAGLIWETDEMAGSVTASPVQVSDNRPGCGNAFALTVPLRDLMPIEGLDWLGLALAQAEVNMPVRMGYGDFPLRHVKRRYGLEEITQEANFYVVRTGGNLIAPTVRVRQARWHTPSQTWRVNCADGRLREIAWCSETRWAELSSVPLQVSRDDVFSAQRVPVLDKANPGTIGLDDYVVVFPESSGVDPVYLAFKARTEYPGLVSGQGKPALAGWLGPKTPAEGATVPAQVARLLSGRVFDRFSHLLSALCKAVAGFPELCTSFSPADMAVLAQGQIPTGAGRFRIDFARNPLDGGDVYDLDNLLIVKSL